VGAAGYPRDGETVEGLLAAADEAMYHAKQRNRDKRR
jgi:GGDEF domain-containing protein